VILRRVLANSLDADFEAQIYLKAAVREGELDVGPVGLFRVIRGVRPGSSIVVC
jgi:hypothetical protein